MLSKTLRLLLLTIALSATSTSVAPTPATAYETCPEARCWNYYCTSGYLTPQTQCYDEYSGTFRTLYSFTCYSPNIFQVYCS